jgi:hypothetical protein
VFRSFAAVALCGLLCGCLAQDDGPRTVSVAGTVTFDGRPVAEGDIVFRSTNPGEHAYAGKIIEGQFSFDATPGQKNVEITATRVVEGKFVEDNPGEKTPVRESYIPAKYNTNSELRAEIPDSGTTDLKFELTGK